VHVCDIVCEENAVFDTIALFAPRERNGMGSLALQSTKWLLDIATRLVKASIRVHNIDSIRDDMAIVFVVNHFTRLETMLMPYLLNKHAGLTVWSLAAAELFVGRIGTYLLSTGNISTKDPDRDKIIVRSLLAGEHPWLIFPEGGMIKDKKLVDHRGMFRIYSRGERRPPHTGAAVLALRTEFYRHKLMCLKDNPDYADQLTEVLERFALDSFEQALSKRTVIIPVNITYFPIRARENFFLRLARAMARDLSKRAIEELSVEGTVLSQDTDIDITLGEPIDVRAYLEAPEYEELMACGHDDMHPLEQDPRSLFNDAARRLMLRYMAAIYDLTTVNHDHIFATLLRHQRADSLTEYDYRSRIFLAIDEAKRLERYRFHGILDVLHREILYEEDNPKFEDFLDLCLKEGILRKKGDRYHKTFSVKYGQSDFHTVRQSELAQVIANEIEPLVQLTAAIRHIANVPSEVLRRRVRSLFVAGEERQFEEDYAAAPASEERKPRDVGRPFLLMPRRIKGGVVLVHGYLAAPREVRAMAEHLCGAGYAVYAPRLKGHGTCPEDLAQAAWEAWYESVNRGYAIMKTITERVIVGGFSTGGTLALLAAARKGARIQGVFSINAPLQLRAYGARLASSVVTMNTLLSRLNMGWEFVENNPENPDINYLRNPIHGVSELNQLMGTMEDALGKVNAPTFIVQGHGDPVVDPESAHLVFEKVGTSDKVLTILDRSRHGIINHEGAEDVFERIVQFLGETRARFHAPLAADSEEAGEEPPATELAESQAG
jgi:esterase/lipase/1-acyl-sn-glycerol-3-phosphate acyltransferase